MLSEVGHIHQEQATVESLTKLSFFADQPDHFLVKTSALRIPSSPSSVAMSDNPFVPSANTRG